MGYRMWVRRLALLGVAAGGTGVLALWGIPKGYSVIKNDKPLKPSSVTASDLHKQVQRNPLPSREDHLTALQETVYDVLIIGGGATGCGIALDAQSRGLKTAVVDKFDFSAGTSSRSTKLIHGGVRYLQKAIFNLDIEQYRMVKEALAERANLIEIAPHLARPLPIMLPVYKWWQVPYYWMGIKAYDVVAGRQLLKPSYFISKSKALERFPMLKSDKLCGALVYYDGQHDDARMCVAIALTAARMGASTANYCKVLSLLKGPNADGKEVVTGARVQDRITGQEFDVKAKCVINATGPGTDFIRIMDQPRGRKICQPSSGVHVVLPAYYSPANMGLLDPATSDGRVIFFLPWQKNTMAGTTDTPSEVTDNPAPTEKEIQFILKEVKNYLNPDINVRRGDVLSAWSGVRPLVMDPNKKDTQSVARNHIIEVSDSNLITIAGGKWTTYRSMAEETVDKAVEVCKLKVKHDCQTKGLMLDGAAGWTPTLFIRLIQDYGLDTDVAEHLASTYGDRAYKVAKIAQLTGKRYPVVGKKLHEDFPYLEAEVTHAAREYACRAADILARRTRLAFLNVHAAEEALPKIIELMAAELGWNKTRQKTEFEHATWFLQKEMSLHLKAEWKNAAINLSKEETNQCIKRFRLLDGENKGYLTVNDLRTYFKKFGLTVGEKQGEPLNEKQLHEILDEVDVSKNAQVDLGEYLQLMSALKAGHLSSSRLATAAEMNEKIAPIPVNRSGGGV